MANPNWVVKDVLPHKDYSLTITFEDGNIKTFDAKVLLSKPFFSSLNNIDFFMKAYADGMTVAWSEDIDIAPEYLYDNSF